MASKLCNFSSLRCILTVLNVFYIATALFLIGVVIVATNLTYFFSASILVGIAVCACVLLLVAIMGLVGTIKHHQVTMFFYMIILGLSGVVLFAVSVAALAMPEDLQKSYFENKWKDLSKHNKRVLQEKLDCCGFDDVWRNYTINEDDSGMCVMSHPACDTRILTKSGHCCHNPIANVTTVQVKNCTTEELRCPGCDPCYYAWEKTVSNGIWVAGSFGLIFSVTQIAGIILTVRYRNLKDPHANPSAFL